MDELDDALPRCPVDLVRLEPAGTVDAPYWGCPAFGVVTMTA